MFVILFINVYESLEYGKFKLKSLRSSLKFKVIPEVPSSVGKFRFRFLFNFRFYPIAVDQRFKFLLDQTRFGNLTFATFVISWGKFIENLRVKQKHPNCYVMWCIFRINPAKCLMWKWPGEVSRISFQISADNLFFIIKNLFLPAGHF